MLSTWARSEPMEENFSLAAEWYDGTNALRHSGVLRWDGADRLTLDASGVETQFDVADLQFAENRPDQIVYRRETVPDFRLILPAELPPGLAARLPAESNYGAWIDRLGLGRSVAAFAVVSAAAVALPDEYLGEKICAAVVFRGRPITLAELNAFLDERGVSAHARPDALVAMPALPTTAVGKVDKKQVVARLMAGKNG